MNKKHTEFPLEKTVDVVMFRQTDYKDALRLKKVGEAKGWKVKISQVGFLKQGNKI